METVHSCPICQHQIFTDFISCKDFTVSHETFSLQKCDGCGFVITNPRPGRTDLPRYYTSDAYISHSNKAQNIIDRVYKIARNFTLQWKYDLIQQYSLKKPLSILDYGCGTGSFLHTCQTNNMAIRGVEPSPTARNQAMQLTNSTINGDLNEIHSQSDAITLWHVLEHVTDLNPTLEKLKNKLEKNGTMFIAVPNLVSYDAKIYSEYWAGYDVPRHLWHFSTKSMHDLLRQHELQITRTVPMKLDAYYVSLLSEKYRHGTTNIGTTARAIIQGWKSNSKAKSTGDYSSLIYIVRK